jgi:tetratricopeptide (TPR) repeat protein
MQPTYSQQTTIDSLNSLLNKSKVDTNYTNTLNNLCLEYKKVYKYKLADSIAFIALKMAQKIDFHNGILKAHLNTAEIQYEMSNYAKSLEMYQRLLQLSAQYNNKKYIGICYHRMAIIYDDLGKFEESLKCNLAALKIRREINDKRGISYSLSNIAGYYMAKSQYTKALSYYFETLKVFIELDDKKSIAYSYYNIGKVYYNIHNYPEAIKYYSLGKKMTFELNDLIAYATIIRSIGEAYQKSGDDVAAIISYKEAIEIATKINDEVIIAMSNSNIGTILQEQKKYSEALKYFSESLFVFKKIDYKVGIIVSDLAIGEVHIKLNNLNLARNYIQKGLDLNKEIGYKEYFKGAYYILFEIDSIQKNWVSALMNYKLYRIYQDSLLEETNSKTIDSLRLNHEYENKSLIQKTSYDKATALLAQKKETERIVMISIICGLLLVSVAGFSIFRNKKKKEKAILDQQKAELSRQVSENNMKALRAQMNPHFIFNCVHTIERLLNDSKIQESKICLVQFSNLTRSVLENSKKKEISLSEEIETLILYMELENLRFRNPFTYNIVIAPGIDIKTTLIPPLILQPFIENSIKHGFRETDKLGHLTIEVQIANELLICIIEDNGIGRKRSMTIKQLSGFKKESMGIKLTEERLQLISKTKNSKAYFFIDDLTDTLNNPTGTRVKMFLPYELSA